MERINRASRLLIWTVPVLLAPVARADENPAPPAATPPPTALPTPAATATAGATATPAHKSSDGKIELVTASRLTGVFLPGVAARVEKQEIVEPVTMALTAIAKAAGGKVGNIEAIMWVDESYKRAMAPGIMQVVNQGLRKAGYVYEEFGSDQTKDGTLKYFGARSAKQKVLGYWQINNDFLLLAWGQAAMLPKPGIKPTPAKPAKPGAKPTPAKPAKPGAKTTPGKAAPAKTPAPQPSPKPTVTPTPTATGPATPTPEVKPE